MGTRGPAPKRSEQRRRRNKTDPVDRGTSGAVNQPKLTQRSRHSAIAVRFWDRLGESAQAVYFQPSDWAYAELVVHTIDQAVKNPTANMIRAAMDGMSRLLVTEADRRRFRMELDAADGPDPEDEAADARVIELVADYGLEQGG